MAFLTQRLRYSEIPDITGAGVYAFSMVDRTAMTSVRVGLNGLLYIGMTESSLEVRNHFFHRDSSFSSFRRSLGALLKDELGLHAIPRGLGRSQKDNTHFRFAAPGEERLTRWMKENLFYSFEVLSTNIRATEDEEHPGYGG